MIILFSSSLGLTAVNSKKKQIEYIDMLIYLGNRISLLLGSTMPDTQEIISILKNDSRLNGFDFSLNQAKMPLNPCDREKIINLFNSIGMYDADTQILIANEFTGYFKMLKKQYQDYYDTHYRLYIIFGLFSGIMVSVLLI